MQTITLTQQMKDAADELAIAEHDLRDGRITPDDFRALTRMYRTELGLEVGSPEWTAIGARRCARAHG